MRTVSGFEIDMRLFRHPFADAGIVFDRYHVTDDIEHRIVRLISGKEGKPIACIIYMDYYKDRKACDRVFYIAPDLAKGELRHVYDFAEMYGIKFSIVREVVKTGKVYSLKNNRLLEG